MLKKVEEELCFTLTLLKDQQCWEKTMIKNHQPLMLQIQKLGEWSLGPQTKITSSVPTAKSLIILRSSVGNFMENHRVLSGIKDLEVEHNKAR